MGTREVGYRIKQTIQARAECLGVGLAGHVDPHSADMGAGWVTELPHDFDPTAYRASADAILRGFFDVFALKASPLGFPPRWNRDPKSGIEAPVTFGKLLDYRQESIVGDIKYLWEPNRHLELVTLAQAWHLTGDDSYLIGCRTLLESWFEQCPYPMGPNWTSSLEHAIRLVNWSFAWHLLGADNSGLFLGEEGRAFKARWMRSIYQHCHFIRGHLSRYSSANNHLLGELTGLYVGSTTWPRWRPSARWRAYSHLELEREALRQNFADGVNREQAIWYQHSVADMMLIAGLVARANSNDFSPLYWQRLQSMLEFVASIMDVAGNVTNIGDSDDGVMVRLAPSSTFHVYRSLLVTGAVLFDRPDFKSKTKFFDDKSRWLLGDRATRQFELLSVGADVQTASRAFGEGGYVVLGDSLDTPDEVRIVADAGPLGYLSIAAHGHADALSFTLSAGGREILIDPGTYSYHTNVRWREYFRGTSAHNTVRVDGENQSVSGGNFLWVRHGNGKLLKFDAAAQQDRLLGAHDGYHYLKDPVATYRQLIFDRRTRTLTVTDTLKCARKHSVEQFWHFGAECALTMEPNEAIARIEDVTVYLKWPAGFSAALVRGLEYLPAGWRSRAYDRREPCSTLIIKGRISGNWEGVSTIRVTFDRAIRPIVSRSR
jgi:hypothetical protein